MGSSFNGRTLEWHSRNRGSIPLGSTRKKVMSVRSRKAIRSRAKKLSIPTQKVVSVNLPYCGGADAREWYRILGEFFDTYKDCPASVEIGVDGYDGYPDDVKVSTIVDKNDDELANEVKAKEDLIAAHQKKIEDKERAELERLEAKYRKKS